MKSSFSIRIKLILPCILFSHSSIPLSSTQPISFFLNWSSDEGSLYVMSLVPVKSGHPSIPTGVPPGWEKREGVGVCTWFRHKRLSHLFVSLGPMRPSNKWKSVPWTLCIHSPLRGKESGNENTRLFHFSKQRKKCRGAKSLMIKRLVPQLRNSREVVSVIYVSTKSRKCHGRTTTFEYKRRPLMLRVPNRRDVLVRLV